MKNKLMSIGTMIIGVLLAAGPQFLFKVCPVGDKPMKCFYTAKALIAVGVILAVVGALQLLAKQAESKRLLAITGAVVCVMSILFPTVLIGSCMKPDMSCNGYPHPVGNRHRFAGHPLFCKQGKGEIILETVYHPEDGGQKPDPQTGA